MFPCGGQDVVTHYLCRQRVGRQCDQCFDCAGLCRHLKGHRIISAMRSNKRRVVPGPLSKVMDFVSTYAPRGALAPIMGRFYAKMGEE